MFLDEEIQPDTWKNIPFPLTDAFKTQNRALKNTENMILELCKQTKMRTECIASKFKLLQTSQHESREKERKIFNLKTQQADKVNAGLKAEITLHRQDTLAEFDTLRAGLKGHRREVQQRFEEYKTARDTENWCTRYVSEQLKELSDAIAAQNAGVVASLDELTKHVTVPGLVGEEGSKFEHLSGWV